MRTVGTTAFLLFLAASVVFAEPPAPEEGRSEVVFGRCGRPYMNIWDKDGDRIVRIEDELAIVAFIYEDSVMVGETITIRSTGAKLSWRYVDGSLTTAGMPAITRTSDSEGRMTSVLADGKPLATYSFVDGYLDQLSLNGGLLLRLSRPVASRVTQSVKSGRRVINEVTIAVADDADALRDFNRSLESVLVPDSARIRAIHALDLVQGDVGTVSGNCLRLQVSASGKLTTVYDGERPVMYVIGCGMFDMLGFGLDGRPLFYDLRMDVRSNVVQPGTRLVVDFPYHQLSHVVPDRILLSRTGATGAYVSSCRADAICGFWSEADVNRSRSDFR